MISLKNIKGGQIMHNLHSFLPQHWMEEYKPLPDEWLKFFTPDFLNRYSDAGEIIKDVAEKFKIAEHFLMLMAGTESDAVYRDCKEVDVIYPCSLKMEGYEGLYNQLHLIASLFKNYYNGVFIDHEDFHNFVEYINQASPDVPKQDFYDIKNLSYYNYELNDYIYFKNSLSLSLFVHTVPYYHKRNATHYYQYSILGIHTSPTFSLVTDVLNKCEHYYASVVKDWFINGFEKPNIN